MFLKHTSKKKKGFKSIHLYAKKISCKKYRYIKTFCIYLPSL
ncbi:MAG: hypothetical protein OJF59_001978 [Cytophagales bacterium]|nr:MAG: hypothetical protein OJF59_001978 [Cytophagales bacterium]